MHAAIRLRVAVLVLALGYGGMLWLAVIHRSIHGAGSLPLALEVLAAGSAVLPVVHLAARQVVARVQRWSFVTVVAPVAVVAAAVLAIADPVAQIVLAGGASMGIAQQVLFDFVVSLALCLPLTAALLLPDRRPGWQEVTGVLGGLRTTRPWRMALAGIVGLATVLAATTTATVTAAIIAAPAEAAGPVGDGACAAATRTITYDVEAFEVDLPLNGWGDHIPNGLVYALSNDDALVSADDIRQQPGRATPLVLRAAVGDCIVVNFTNRVAGERVGMHVDGVTKEVTGDRASDGGNIGFNTDSTLATGQTRTYTWFADRPGQFPINDYGSGTDFGLDPAQHDTTSRGLYGGLVVVPAGFTWHDERTGTNLLNADRKGIGAPVFADARGPGAGDDFRDIALLFMDEPEGVLDRDGQAPTFPHTGAPDVSFGFNYRTEPLRNRLRAVDDHLGGRTVTLPNGTVVLPEDRWCDGWTNDQSAEDNTARLAKDRGVSGCVGEESHLQSWPFGDQGKMTTSVDEIDVLSVAAEAGTFTLTVKDPTLTGPLATGLEGARVVDTAAPRFRDERTTTDPIPYDATAEQVTEALMGLKVLPLAELSPGDITVTGGPGSYTIAFGQHFAGRDVDVEVDGAGLTGAGATAAVSDTAEGATKGRIDVLSDALIPHAYRGDPVRVRLIHPGIKETHPFHQHTNRWRQESEDPNSTRLDVQSIGPGQSTELVYEGGAGEAITSDPAVAGSPAQSAAEWLTAGRPDLAALAITKASNGDQIFHCHLYPHFAQGFWGALRVFDRQRPADPALWPADVPRTYPDATPVEPLMALPDLDKVATNPTTGQQVRMTPMPDAAHPGYPLMVKGEYGQRAYRAPGAVSADEFGAPELNWRRPGDTVRDVDSEVTTDLERANMVTTGTGEDRHAIPGSFFIDPCPAGVPQRRYSPAAIDAKIVYNQAGWHDPNGKLYVEAPPTDPNDPSSAIDVAARIRTAIDSGQKQAEPYNMRANLGDCVTMATTNATHLDNDRGVPADVHDGQLGAPGGPNSGGNAFHLPTLMSELSTHVHLVRFDELATDGTSVGWNYVQAAMVGQTYNYRWFVDVPLRTVYFHDHQNPNTHQQHGLWAAMNVEPTTSKWTDPTTGAPLVPGYCKDLGLAGTGGDPACYGVGSVADIKVPSTVPGTFSASFREFTVNYSDFVPLVDAAGQPINPPGAPDRFAADQGGMGINYRNEPFPTRINSESTGAKKEPAHVFSSAVHGDPSTPIFRAYPGDQVIFRFMGGAHEEGHTFTLSGHRWLHEPDDPNSNLFDSQFVMISEFFNMEVSGNRTVKRGDQRRALERAREASLSEGGSTKLLPGGAGDPGDYLYSSQPLNDLWMGMWGIFRVQAARTGDLQPLPTNAAPAEAKRGSEWPAVQPGGDLTPPRLLNAKPCPAGAPKRTYDISMITTRIDYNQYGDHDPNGVAYVLDQDLDKDGKPQAGTALEPLFIRANEGDCVEINFTNRLPQAGVGLGAGDPINPVEMIGTEGTSTVTNRDRNGRLHTVRPTWPTGNRGSIHPSGLVRYDVLGGDGAAIGYNFDTTVGPGETIKYRHYIDNKNIGVATLADYGNLRTTRHHGAWGALIAEPRGSAHLTPADQTPLPGSAGDQAVIRFQDTGGTVREYREFVVDVQDGLNLFDEDGNQIQDQIGPEEGGGVEREDMGEVGINYRSEPFTRRLAGASPDVADVFSSRVHGDPATPLLRAYPNDPTMVRILNSQDLPRVHTFGMHGHSWRYEQNDPNSNIITAQGGVTTSRAFNAGVCAGANTPMNNTGGNAECGTGGFSGDYLYGDRNFFHMLSGGVWGLVRVHDSTQPDLKPLGTDSTIPGPPVPPAPPTVTKPAPPTAPTKPTPTKPTKPTKPAKPAKPNGR